MYFSVVIPVYNRENLIVRCLESVINQTYKNFEIIVVDDGSTDNTVSKILERFSKNIILIKSTSNNGNASARNLGVLNSRGNYICFLDSDDIYHKNYLEYIYDMISKYNTPGFLWVNIARTNDFGLRKELTFPDKWFPELSSDPYTLFLTGIYFGTDYGFAVRHDVFKKIGLFDENLRVAVDTDFILRAVKETNFAYTRKVLVETFNHSGNRVRTDILGKIHSYERIITKHPIIMHNRNLYKIWNYKLMWMNYHIENYRCARHYLYNLAKCFYLKAIILATLFEIFPQVFAIYLHKKFT